MRVILSRKGFDSEYGGYPSPVFSDETLISLPIPSLIDSDTYDSLICSQNRSYFELIRSLKTKIRINKRWTPLTKKARCHLDPDIVAGSKDRPSNWLPLFGQVGASQSHLDKQQIKEGDLFLFFGWFEPDRHIIFGYLQIGKVIQITRGVNYPPEINYHPHFKYINYKWAKHNAVYISKRTLSWDDRLPGAGVFKYHPSLVLTADYYKRSCWKLPLFFKDLNVSYHSKSSQAGRFFNSARRGQEFVVEESKNVEEWAKGLIGIGTRYYSSASS